GFDGVRGVPPDDARGAGGVRTASKVDEPEILREIHLAGYLARHPDRQVELPGIRIDLEGGGVLDAELERQGNRIRVDRPVGLEIEDRQQHLEAAGVCDLSTGECPSTGYLRRDTGTQSEGRRRRRRPGH